MCGPHNLQRVIHLPAEKCVCRIHDYQPSVHILLLFSNYYIQVLYTPTKHMNILLSLKTYMVLRDEFGTGRRVYELDAFRRGRPLKAVFNLFNCEEWKFRWQTGTV